MAFDKPTRNRLAKFVADARRVIADEFTEQFQSLYGISAKGDIAPLGRLGHLDDAGIATAALLRERIEYLEKTHPDDKDGTRAAVSRLAREQAFTILNRFAAIRMAEKRGLIVESIAKGYQSAGFRTFMTVAGSALGETFDCYRRYLFCLFDELAIDLGVFFDRRSPQSLLFPRKTALEALLDLLHAADLERLWAEDETIGWIYQYYNDPEERKKMRKESAAPRNSRELAVRNQFFTPRYVVEFLTDNTLGRIWYEMCRGQTRLADQCRYLVRRPTEIFLAEGETAPETPDQEGLSQEELLKQPVHIPHRPLKDPREIRLLDPACGSMHFGLYAFDIFETIYEEAWDNGTCAALKEAYTTKEELLKDIPRLIIEHNIHGIDIDPRATQIAGLSLWLRAQKAWQKQNVPAAERPRIRRSNIVCAEPMPGSPEMLDDFVATLNPPLLGELVKTVFDKMQLAGEAGSLLKIEEEIRTTIETARKAWEGLQTKPRELFTVVELNKVSKQPELTGLEKALTSDLRPLTSDFWTTAEQQVIDALSAYAEQADADSYQRRLFADDAARGFAFIDLCRKRYDVVVMNPPFGSFSKLWSKQSKVAYPNSANDILGAFVERFLHRLYHKGRLGAITSRACFFLTTFTDWRRNVVLKDSAVRAIADLGQGVMDDAVVEAAAYVLESTLPTSSVTVFRAIADADRQRALEACLDAHQAGESESRLFLANQQTFDLLPDSPFVYWVAKADLEVFDFARNFESAVGDVRCGLSTNNNPRFVRAVWEIEPKDRFFCYYPTRPPTDRCSFDDPVVQAYYRRKEKGRRIWSSYVMSGSSQPWFSPLTVTVNWENEGAEIKEYARTLGNSPSRNVRSENFYFRPGMSWTRRAVRFYPYVVSGNSIPSASRYIAFPNSGKEAEALAVCASRTVSAFLRFYAEFWQRPNFLVDTLKALPWPNLPEDAKAHFEQLISCEVRQRRLAYQNHEPFHEFLIPGKICDFSSGGLSLGFETESLLDAEAEKKVADAFGFCEEQSRSIERDLLEAISYQKVGGATDEETEEKSEGSNEDVEEADSDFVLDYSKPAQEEAFLSYLFGTAFGRWDIRYATGERQPPELPNPFDPLPVCPPGMLQNAEGLPMEKDEGRRMREERKYPLRVSWDGILVDDENHPDDIVARVREAIELIWKDRAEAIEQEACGILGVKTLRDYFRRPAAFFADHLKRYSMSRRQAPIYWPLATKSGSYTLWLYYHRLTDQTLHTCLADFLDPKIRKVQSELDALTCSGGGGSRAGDLREFLDELKDLRDEMNRVIKLPWKPNLNDGVLITASPLHKLFRLPKWQKDLKACWDKLAKGDYDWAHLAYTIWPQRVEKACEKDRSIAIAHGLEHLCKIAPPKSKKKRGEDAPAEPEEQVEDLEDQDE